MKEIYSAVIRVMEQVGYVQKKGAKGLTYKFVGEADLIQALRPAMIAEGLFLYPTSVTLETGDYTTGRGTPMNQAFVVVGYQLAHAPSGQSFPLQVAGEASDTGDKATAKAMTIAYKYALRELFMIETGDDPDEIGGTQIARGLPYKIGQSVIATGPKGGEKEGVFKGASGKKLSVNIDGEDYLFAPSKVRAA